MSGEGAQKDKVRGPASYFAAIERAHGRPAADWLALIAPMLAARRHMEVVAWLKSEHGMGHGHANALVAYARSNQTPSEPDGAAP